MLKLAGGEKRGGETSDSSWDELRLFMFFEGYPPLRYEPYGCVLVGGRYGELPVETFATGGLFIDFTWFCLSLETCFFGDLELGFN